MSSDQEPPPEVETVAAEQESGKPDSSKASVQDTVRFIFNHASIAYYDGYRFVESTFVLEEDDSCQAKVKAKPKPNESIELDIDFQLLNPKSIENTDQSIKVRATNGESIVKGVHTETWDAAQSRTSPISEQYFTLYLREARDIQKVEEALRHAIVQCGGQEDLFSGKETERAGG